MFLVARPKPARVTVHDCNGMGAHGALPALASGRGDKSGEATGAARNASARCWRAEIRHSPRGQLGRRAVTDQSVLQHSLPSHPASETGFILMWLRAAAC